MKSKDVAIKHLVELQKRNPSFNGCVVYCEKAKEWVVNDIKGNIHLHIIGHENLSDWEMELIEK